VRSLDRILAILVAAVLVAGCRENVDGYEGIAWGSPVSVATERGLSCSERDGSMMCKGSRRLGGGSAEEHFAFDRHGRLRNVILQTPDGQYEELKKLIESNYGEGHGSPLKWETTTTEITLNGPPFVMALFTSKLILREQRAEEAAGPRP
jgi:hypothetical protein